MPSTTIFKTALPARTASAAAAPLVLQPLWQPTLSALVLTSGRIQIGGASNCDLRIEAPGVAAHHASLLAGPHKVVLRAWDQRTWVNDTPVKEVTLRAGDRVAIGPVLFRVRPATADDLLQQLPQPVEPPRCEQPAAVHRARTVHAETESSGADEAAPPAVTLPASGAAVITPVRETIETVVRSHGPLLGEWCTAPSGGIVGEWYAEIPQPGRPRLTIPSLTPAPSQAELDALIESRLAEHRTAWEAELQAWERQQEAWLTAIAGQSAQLEQRERDLNRRQLLLDQQQQQLAQQQTDLQCKTERLQREAAERQRELQTIREGLQSERDRMEAVLSQARNELAAETERQAQACREWESAHQRLTSDVANQLAEIATRRAELVARSEELTAAESVLAESRTALLAERAQFDALRQSFDAEQRRWNDWRRVQESELRELQENLQRLQSQHAAELQRRAQSDAELQAARQTLQHDRRQLWQLHADWQSEREAHWDDLNRRRQQLEADAATLESHHRLVCELAASLEVEVRAAQTERERLQQRPETSAGPGAMPEPSPELLERARQQAQAALASERAELQQQWQAADLRHREIEATLQELSAERERLKNERDELSLEQQRWKSELDAELERLESRQRVLEEQQRAHDDARQKFELQRLALEQELAAVVAERELRRLDSQFVTSRQDEPPSAAEHSLIEPERSPLPETCHDHRLADLWSLTEPQTRSLEPDRLPIDSAESSAGCNRTDGACLTDRERLPQQPDAWHASSAGKDILADVEELVSAAEQRGATTAIECEVSPSQERNDFDHDWTLAPFDLTVTASENGTAAPARTGPLNEHSPPSESDDRPIIDSVNSLRMELARLFGLPEDEGLATPEPQPSQAPDSSGPTVAELISDVPTEKSACAVNVSTAPSDGEFDEWQNRLDSLIPHAESAQESSPSDAAPRLEFPQESPATAIAAARPLSVTVTSEIETARPSCQASEERAAPPPAAEPEDSIAAYLEQLLARNRRPGDTSPAPVYKSVYERNSAGHSAPAEGAAAADSLHKSASTPDAESDHDDRSHLDAAPRHLVDKQETRETIQSFREVANYSARSALARHRWRVDRAEIAVHAVLALTTGAMGGFFFYSPLWEGVVHWPRGMGCLIASAWSLRKCLTAIQRLRKFYAMEARVKNMTTISKSRSHRSRTGDAELTADDGPLGAPPETDRGRFAPDRTMAGRTAHAEAEPL